ncbi:MAG: fibronectin type III domain-containing protein [Solirubrobacterales bacterium]
MGSIGIVAAVTAAFAAVLFALALVAPPFASAVLTGVVTKPATDVGKTHATFSGSFTSFGGAATFSVEWGETEAYGNTTPSGTPPVSGGPAPADFHPFTLTGLTGSTTYHYRIKAEDGGYSYGADRTFTTDALENVEADPPTAVTDKSAELNASFDGEGTPADYYFEWGLTAAYGNTTPAPPGNAAPVGTGKIAVPPVSISGLEDDAATYHYRVVVTNSNGISFSDDRTFRTAAPPLVSNLNTRNVQATSAELTGEINPRAGQTTYRFEYGPSATYGNSVPIPAGDAGSGDSAQPVSAQVEGLVPGLTYHFRLVATNPFGTTASPDQTFGFYPPACPNAQLRQETRSNDLPDCRAYELVTPSFAQGTSIMPLAGPTSGLATNPPRLAYGGVFGLFPEYTGEPTNALSDLYVSTRTDNGWTQRYIGLTVRQAPFMGGPPGAIQVSPNQGSNPSWGQRGTQATPNLDRIINYNWGYPGNVTLHAPPSNAPYLWDVASGSLLERWPSNLKEVTGGEGFIGFPRASADFSHFVFSSNVVFAEGGEASPGEFILRVYPEIEDIWPREYVYDNNLETGTVVLASRKADGTPFEGRAFDISEDGSRILMTDEATLPGKEGRSSGKTTPLEFKETIGDSQITGPLYLRVNGTTTYEIAPEHMLEYAGSTADGATVYLTSEEQLTADDHDSSRDLYVWRESDPSTLTLVSIGDHGNSGDTDACAPNEGWTSACSISRIALERAGFDTFGTGKNGADGSYGNGISDNYLASKTGDIYFESPEQLVGQKGKLNERNLYLYRGGALRYVTTMKPKLGIDRIQVTPDGNYMAFSTGSSITDYDAGGKWQMYLYGAQSGQLVCASCRPDNQPPVSAVAGSQNGLFLTYDGRVFYSTNDALVPRDTNQVQDVYEYTEGKPQLITTGSGAGQEAYLGGLNAPGLVNVSANGTDVYFATTDTLVTQDHNGSSMKIYDARTGGGFPAEREEPSCVAADECHGPGASPPPLPADRTSAGFGTPRKAKAHKAKKHKKAGKHKKHKKKQAGKAKRKSRSAKQGGKRHG